MVKHARITISNVRVTTKQVIQQVTASILNTLPVSFIYDRTTLWEQDEGKAFKAILF
jgi:hypothetical protein